MTNEVNFRRQVLKGEIDWSQIEDDAVVYELLSNTLRVDPNERWNSKTILNYLQSFVIIEIQRVFRGRNIISRFCKACLPEEEEFCN